MICICEFPRSHARMPAFYKMSLWQCLCSCTKSHENVIKVGNLTRCLPLTKYNYFYLILKTCESYWAMQLMFCDLIVYPLNVFFLVNTDLIHFLHRRYHIFMIFSMWFWSIPHFATSLPNSLSCCKLPCENLPPSLHLLKLWNLTPRSHIQSLIVHNLKILSIKPE